MTFEPDHHQTSRKLLLQKSYATLVPRLVIAASIVLALVGCIPATIYPNWAYADLRLLDTPDTGPTPSTDIVAVYTRTYGSDLEIRVDLLDISVTPDYDLVLHLATARGKLTVTIPASGRPMVSPSGSGISIRVVRDPWLDTVTVRFNRYAISQPFTLQVTSFVPGDPKPADETPSVRSDAPPPLTRAPLLIAFQDTYPAVTPAQALRRWDGAHSGPRGERHGLKHIVDGAAQYHVPVALLDLKSPSSLAALNFAGVLPIIQELANLNLLILPDVAYAEPADIALGFSRKTAAGFNIPASPFIYGHSLNFFSNRAAQFIALQDPSHLGMLNGIRLIPLCANTADQAGIDGPSLDVRRQLIITANASDPSRLLVLGGELPQSTWGNENSAGPTFAWIAAHPWIEPLTGNDLLTFPIRAEHNNPSAASGQVFGMPNASPLLAELQNVPNNPITDTAWRTWFMLTAPTTDEKLQSLRVNYINELGGLLAAAKWAGDPTTQANCSNDINGDGLTDCILSTNNYFSLLDRRGGRLSLLFHIDASGAHQLIGPSSQFAIGLSDPSLWQPGKGEDADPSVIHGAFSDDSDIWDLRSPSGGGEITFASPDGSQLKIYRLTQSGLSVSYQGAGIHSTRIPLALDPDTFYFGPTQYQSTIATGVLTWGIINGANMEVDSDAVMTMESFTDSQAFFNSPENPDTAFPGGHYLPFPLSVITLESDQNFMVQISGK